MNVFAPVACLKFGECCCVTTTKKKMSESEQIEMVPIQRGLPQNVCVAIEDDLRFYYSFSFVIMRVCK